MRFRVAPRPICVTRESVRRVRRDVCPKVHSASFHLMQSGRVTSGDLTSVVTAPAVDRDFHESHSVVVSIELRAELSAGLTTFRRSKRIDEREAPEANMVLRGGLVEGRKHEAGSRHAETLIAHD